MNERQKAQLERDAFDGARTGNTDRIRRVLHEGVDLSIRGHTECTLLHLAAENGHKEVALMLIAADAEIGAENEYREKPSDLARSRNHGDLAVLLDGIENGTIPRPDPKDYDIDMEARAKEIKENGGGHHASAVKERRASQGEIGRS